MVPFYRPLRRRLRLQRPPQPPAAPLHRPLRPKQPPTWRRTVAPHRWARTRQCRQPRRPAPANVGTASSSNITSSTSCTTSIITSTLSWPHRRQPPCSRSKRRTHQWTAMALRIITIRCTTISSFTAPAVAEAAATAAAARRPIICTMCTGTARPIACWRPRRRRRDRQCWPAPTDATTGSLREGPGEEKWSEGGRVQYLRNPH